MNTVCFSNSGVSAWRSARGTSGLSQNVLAEQGYLMLVYQGTERGFPNSELQKYLYACVPF